MSIYINGFHLITFDPSRGGIGRRLNNARIELTCFRAEKNLIASKDGRGRAKAIEDITARNILTAGPDKAITPSLWVPPKIVLSPQRKHLILTYPGAATMKGRALPKSASIEAINPKIDVNKNPNVDIVNLAEHPRLIATYLCAASWSINPIRIAMVYTGIDPNSIKPIISTYP